MSVPVLSFRKDWHLFATAVKYTGTRIKLFRVILKDYKLF